MSSNCPKVYETIGRITSTLEGFRLIRMTQQVPYNIDPIDRGGVVHRRPGRVIRGDVAKPSANDYDCDTTQNVTYEKTDGTCQKLQRQGELVNLLVFVPC